MDVKVPVVIHPKVYFITMVIDNNYMIDLKQKPIYLIIIN